MTHLSGYDTDFVDPPQELQYDCSICLSILRDPQLFNCCGMSFCQGCIQPLFSERNFKCPLCKGDPNPIVPDKRLQRSLNQREVYCHKKGCEWTGLLADFDNHLNLMPSPGLRLEGCPYVILKCLYCSEEYQREELEDHEKKCPQKPYECEYCKKFTGTKSVLSSQHYGVCRYYPIPCTNECGDKVVRCGLKSHLINDCPLTTVNCDYHYAGCEAWLMRRDLSDHLAKHARKHAAFLAEENTLLFLDVSRLQRDLHSVVSENMTCVEMNESLLQEQDKLLKKTQEDENELSVVYVQLGEKEAEIKQLERKFKEAEERATKASKDHKKALDQCKTKDTVLKTHTAAIQHYKEQVDQLEGKLEEAVLESTKKESLLDRFERKNTSLQTKLDETSKEMEALKVKQKEELQAIQFELERKIELISQQEKQLEKLKNSPSKPHQFQEGEEWPDPENFDPYQVSGSSDGADSFTPYTTYHEQRMNSELSQPFSDDKEAPENSEWIRASSKKTKAKKLAASKSIPMGTAANPASGMKSGTAPIPWQRPLPASISSTKNKLATPMNFSAALKKNTETKAPPSTPPRMIRPQHNSPSSSKRPPLLESPKEQFKLMIRNTPSHNRGVTNKDISRLFSQFGHVWHIDRKGSNTAVVYDNIESVTKGVVASDRKKLECGGIVLNCTYEKKEKK